ncbi:MAG: cytochrome c biogenesis protein CcdA [bacterium]
MLTILTPCVLPMIPLYLAFLTGKTIQEQKDNIQRLDILRLVVPFIVGFTLVFVTLGATATLLGNVIETYRDVLQKVLGVFIFLFALKFLGLLPSFNFMLKDTRLLQKIPKGWCVFELSLWDCAFALGWSPCVGPILASILALAAVKETVFQGMGLLFVYSMGFMRSLLGQYCLFCGSIVGKNI